MSDNSIPVATGLDSVATAALQVQLSKMRKAVRAVHQRYKEKCIEVADLRAQVKQLEQENDRLRGAVLAQGMIVDIAERVLGIGAHHGGRGK